MLMGEEPGVAARDRLTDHLRQHARRRSSQEVSVHGASGISALMSHSPSFANIHESDTRPTAALSTRSDTTAKRQASTWKRVGFTPSPTLRVHPE
ncbi:MAG: hypothetical protein ACRCYU_22050 [Nocardioides sp.]